MKLLERHFDTAFAAPDGIEKLRELILTLAVQGKLERSYPSDQPASELLKNIAKKKQRLIKGEGLRTSADERIDLDEEYVGRPFGWEYCRLGNLARFIDYRGRTPKKVDSGIPLITAKNVRFGFINREPYEYIVEDDYELWMTRGFPKLGDLLFTTEAPLGNIAIIDIKERFALAQRVICLQLHDSSMGSFLKWLIMSVPFQSQLIDNATGMTAKGIKSARLKEIPIPVPPIEEQRRIVAKIDQLMGRCDELEKLRAERDRLQVTVHKVACDRLLIAKDPDTFTQSWQFITQHFSELYSVKENVTELRKAILQLAVMGKLVRQSNQERPASFLIEEIRKQVNELIKQKLEKRIVFDSIESNNENFKIPENWSWSRLGSLLQSIKYGTSKKCTYNFSGSAILRIPNIDVESGCINAGDLKYTNLSDEEFQKVSLMPDDLLMIRSNGSRSLVGRVAVVSDDDKGYGYAGYLVRLRSVPECVYSRYLFFALNTVFVRRQIERPIRTTSGVKNINSKEIANLLVPLPPLSEQYLIVDKIDRLIALCKEVEKHVVMTQKMQSDLLIAVLSQI